MEALIQVITSASMTDAMAGVGLIATIAGTYWTARSYALSRRAAGRLIDVKLWRLGDRTVEAQFILSNGGPTTTLLDRIEVLWPRGVRVAWSHEPDPYAKGKTLLDKDCPSVHEVRLLVEPSKSGTVGMLMLLPRSMDRVSRVKMRARISANDIARRYIWKAFAAKPSMATDQRPINKSILGTPEDRYP